MPPRKRRFEALEDRRLLTAIVGPALMSPIPAALAAEASAPPGAATPATTPSAAENSDVAESDGDSSENYVEDAPAETASSAGAAAATSSSDAAGYVPSSSYYPSSSYDQGSYNDYATGSTYSSKTPPVSHSSLQPATVTPILQPSGADSGKIQANASPSDSAPINLPSAGAVPSASSSPPVARSLNSDLARGGLDPVEALSAPIASGSIDMNAALWAPIAWEGDWARLTSRGNLDEPAGAVDGEMARAMDNHSPSLVIGSVGVNLAALEAGIDAVFDRLERLGDELTASPGAVRFSQWLVVATGACAAFEYAYARYREGGPWQTSGEWPILVAPRLRRRWFHLRRKT
jgi:hypothetical protein